MNNLSQILINVDWKIIIAGFALCLSVFNLWYSVFRKGKLLFCCSRWTAIGIDAFGKPASTFAVKIDIINTGSRSIILKDLLLEARTDNHKIVYYDPILLFDLTYYIASVGKDRRMTDSQKGMPPIPIAIPAGKQFDFSYEILFMPLDKKTAIENENDLPCELALYALTGKSKKYKPIGSQEVMQPDLKEFASGSFSGMISTSSMKLRQKFIERRQEAKENKKFT